MKDDADLFREEMQGVAPLVRVNRLRVKKPAANNPGLEARRRAALGSEDERREVLSEKEVDLVSPQAILSFQRPGIQHGVLRKLRLGKYLPNAQLDLHRMTVKQARTEIQRFIEDCLAADIRYVLITHGKGEGRKPHPALLKSHVATWLPQMDQVLAFHSAQNYQGGTGATCVLLRKSERHKNDTGERHIDPGP